MKPNRETRLVRASCGACMLAGCLFSSLAQAQTWTAERATPALRELVAIDQTGEPGWLFGPEDVAGDGLDTFAAAERAADVRSTYIAARRNRLWVRVYVSGPATATDMKVYGFVDADRSSATGGTARAPEVDAALGVDASAGGYELVLGLHADPEQARMWRWSEDEDRFEELTEREALDIDTDAGADLDPLRSTPQRHGYLQLEVELAPLGVGVTCDANLLFRASAPGGLRDADIGVVGPCVPNDDNDNGVADLAETDAQCTTDEQCPADGTCVDARCRVPDPRLSPGEAVQGGALTCETAGPSGRGEYWVTLGLALCFGRRRFGRRQAPSCSVAGSGEAQ